MITHRAILCLSSPQLKKNKTCLTPNLLDFSLEYSLVPVSVLCKKEGCHLPTRLDQNNSLILADYILKDF